MPQRQRRVFTVANKLRIVKEAAGCLASGNRGALETILRPEGIYNSQLSLWRTKLSARRGGSRQRSRIASRSLPKFTEVERRCAKLEKRNAELERKLHVATVLIELQKKAHELLGLALPQSDGDNG